MMKYTKTILATIFAILLMASAVSAVSLELTNVETPLDEYDEGDKIAIKYSIKVEGGTAGETHDVDTIIYIDEDKVRTKTHELQTGQMHNEIFTYKTDGMTNGRHEVVIKATLLDDDNWVADRETEEFDFTIEGGVDKKSTTSTSTAAHAMTITSVSMDTKAKPGEKSIIRVTVKNTGGAVEYNTRVSVEVGGKREETQPFTLQGGGMTYEKSITITAPSVTGPHQVEIKAYNGEAEDIEIREIEVYTNEFSANADPDTVEVGEAVTISGFVSEYAKRIGHEVRVYRGTSFIGSVPVEANGYYSTQLVMEEAGTHTIKLAVGDTYREVLVNVAAKGEEITKIHDGTTYIVVGKQGDTKVYAAADTTETTEEGPQETQNGGDASFVDISLSTKEVDVPEDGDNIVSVTVTNNLGKSELFRVETSGYPDEWVFLPQSEVIEDGDAKTFQIYIKPLDAVKGRYEGTVSVVFGEEDEHVKEVPLAIFVAMSQEEIDEELSGMTGFFLRGIGSTGSLVVVGIILVVLILSRIDLDDDGVPDMKELMQRTSVDTELRRPKKVWQPDMRTYHVPDDNVRY